MRGPRREEPGSTILTRCCLSHAIGLVCEFGIMGLVTGDNTTFCLEYIEQTFLDHANLPDQFQRYVTGRIPKYFVEYSLQCL